MSVKHACVRQITLTPKANPAHIKMSKTHSSTLVGLGEIFPTNIIPDSLLFGGWPCP